MADIKTEVEGIYRTPDGYLINKDNKALDTYKKNKMRAMRMNTLGDDVDQLKKEMSEIKELLIKALNK